MAKLGYSRQLMREFLLFARQNKIFWILPLVLLLVAAGVVIAGSSAVAPFIYVIW